jgi:hypothetical protein
MTANAPTLLQRLRAALRPPAQDAEEPSEAGEIKGFVDGCVAGEVRGWARDPSRPNRRVHVMVLEKDRVVAEALADQPRADLVKAGHGDGRHGFRVRLPAALLNGERRRLRVEAIVGGQALQLRKGEFEITPSEADGTATPASAAARAAAGTAIVEPEPAPLALAIWPGRGGKAALPADWASSGGRLVKLGQAKTSVEALAGAHTVLFARAGHQIDPRAGGLLQRSRPLSDVLTWDGASAASRRPEARALGVLLGETLGGAFAVRGHVFNLMGREFAEAVAKGDIRRVELMLAGRPELRWAHLPGRVTQAATADEPKVTRSTPTTPAHAPKLLSIGIWPAWNEAAEASLRSLLEQAPAGMDIEVLTPAGGADQARAFAEGLGRAGILVRSVDAPAPGASGAWLAALTGAAAGEVVIVCQAGVVLEAQPGSVEAIAAWALSPLTGVVTAPIGSGSADPLAGLALERAEDGWASRSAFAPELEGHSRPILAAPASFLAIGRDKLAMLGEAASDRLPAGGVDLDLGLRLRRLGLPSVLLGHLSAEAQEGVVLSGGMAGAALAAFDPAELAAAAAAYPAPGD